MNVNGYIATAFLMVTSQALAQPSAKAPIVSASLTFQAFQENGMPKAIYAPENELSVTIDERGISSRSPRATTSHMVRWADVIGWKGNKYEGMKTRDYGITFYEQLKPDRSPDRLYFVFRVKELKEFQSAVKMLQLYALKKEGVGYSN